jgi:hypothetical protein
VTIARSSDGRAFEAVHTFFRGDLFDLRSLQLKIVVLPGADAAEAVVTGVNGHEVIGEPPRLGPRR